MIFESELSLILTINCSTEDNDFSKYSICLSFSLSRRFRISNFATVLPILQDERIFAERYATWSLHNRHSFWLIYCCVYFS